MEIHKIQYNRCADLRFGYCNLSAFALLCFCRVQQHRAKRKRPFVAFGNTLQGIFILLFNLNHSRICCGLYYKQKNHLSLRCQRCIQFCDVLHFSRVQHTCQLVYRRCFRLVHSLERAFKSSCRNRI